MRDIYHFDILHSFNSIYYKDIFNLSDINDSELAIKNKDIEETEYFYEIKKGKETYLLPSYALQDLPIKVIETIKISFKNKGFHKITRCQSVNIKAEQTMNYRDMIDKWLDYEHEEPELWKLWKIIIDTAYCSRINIRIMTHPGWGKDSPITVLRELRGDCVTVNKPSLAKLKYLLSNKNKIIGINEVQNVKGNDMEDLAKYMEDSGDFKPEYENPKRSSGHALERCDIRNLSTLIFYNFPDEDIGEDNSTLFDSIFHDKIKSRIFPLLFKGGTKTITACKQNFGHITDKITNDEILYLTNWIRAHKFYENKYPTGTEKFTRRYHLKNTRWERNIQAILARVDMYCDNQEEFNHFEDLLLSCHKEYLDYIDKKKTHTGYEGITEEVI